VAGRVVDTAGRPVGDARVSLSAPNLSREADSLGDGSFRLPGLPDGAYHLTADKEGYSRVGEAPEVQVAGGSVAGLELRLERGGSITGRILGLNLLDNLPDNEALAGIEIWAGGPAGGRAGLADPTGAYRVDNVPPGDWSVEARLPNGRQARGVVTLAPGQEQAVLDLELGAGLVITGSLSRGGAPVAGAGVTLSGEGALPGGTAVTDAQGRFRIESLAPGKYEILIPLAEGNSHRQSLELTADQELKIELPAAGTAPPKPPPGDSR
jgi:hypothetical protein